MVDKRASLILELQDKASAGLSLLKGHWLAVTAAIGGTVLFLKEAYMEWGKSREAVVKLDTALANLGGAQDGASKRLQDLANALQKTTTFADDDIVAMEAMLVQYRMTETQVAKLTPLILDMAAATGMDLRTAAMSLGRAIETGSIGALTRMGLAVDETKFKMDAVGTVTDALRDKFEGMARTIAGEPLGKLEQFKNTWSDLMEVIGELVAGPAAQILEWLKSLVEFLIYLREPLMVTMELFRQTLSIVTLLAQAMSLAFTFHFNEAQKVAQMAFTKIKNFGVATTNDMNKQIKKSNDDHRKGETEAERKYREEQEKYHADWSKKMTASINAIQKEREQNVKDSLTRINTLSSAKSKELAFIGKSVAIAQATMDTYAAAAKALTATIPPWNFALAAGVVAAGLANVAQISGVQLAEGGIVLPRSGGTLATIGEAGRAEAVIPLDDPQAQSMLGGMGNTEIHIHAGVLVADSESMRKLAIEIDRKLYELKQNNQVLSF